MLFKITTNPVPANPQVKDTELKLYTPALNRGMDWGSIAPFIQQSTDTFLRPALGDEFYQALEDEYTISGTWADANVAKAARFIRTGLAHHALYLALPHLAMRVSDAGTNETTADGIAPVRQWVMTMNRWETLKTAYTYIDMALQFMERRVAVADTAFDLWKNSEVYTIQKALLISDAREMQARYNIRTSRLGYLALRPYIQKAQDMRVRNVIGPMLDELIEQKQANTLTVPNIALLPLVQALLAEHTISFAVPDLHFTNDGHGWMVSENLFDTRLDDKADKAVQTMLTRAETTAAELEIKVKNLLYANLDDYPTFRDSPYNELAVDSNENGTPDVEERDYYGPGRGAVII